MSALWGGRPARGSFGLIGGSSCEQVFRHPGIAATRKNLVRYFILCRLGYFSAPCFKRDIHKLSLFYIQKLMITLNHDWDHCCSLQLPSDCQNTIIGILYHLLHCNLQCMSYFFEVSKFGKISSCVKLRCLMNCHPFNVSPSKKKRK